MNVVWMSASAHPMADWVLHCVGGWLVSDNPDRLSNQMNKQLLFLSS